jgi:hypothetical protein
MIQIMLRRSFFFLMSGRMISITTVPDARSLPSVWGG